MTSKNESKPALFYCVFFIELFWFGSFVEPNPCKSLRKNTARKRDSYFDFGNPANHNIFSPTTDNMMENLLDLYMGLQNEILLSKSSKETIRSIVMTFPRGERVRALRNYFKASITTSHYLYLGIQVGKEIEPNDRKVDRMLMLSHLN